VLSVLLGVGTMIWLSASRLGPGLRITCLLATMAVAVAGILSSPTLSVRLARMDPFADQRIEAWRLTLKGIADAPWTGHGAGAYRDSFRAYAHPGLGGADWDHAHNTYLELAFELGVPATAIFLGALVIVIHGIRRGLRHRRRARPALIFALGTAVAGAAHALVDFSLEMPATAALFAIILGLGRGLASPRQMPISPSHRTYAAAPAS
jgi:O-antigen ligase